TRQVPIFAELVTIFRRQIDTFGVAADGRIFSSDRGRPVASTAISDVWAEARTLALTPAQVVSPSPGGPTICGMLRFPCGSTPGYPRLRLPNAPGTARSPAPRLCQVR